MWHWIPFLYDPTFCHQCSFCNFINVLCKMNYVYVHAYTMVGEYICHYPLEHHLPKYGDDQSLFDKASKLAS